MCVRVQVMASLSMGWQMPVTLSTGQAQSGQVDENGYVYYQVYIPPSTGADEAPPVLTLTLTPTEGSDQDLFVSMDRNVEPGKSSYHYKSTAWGDVDEVVIRPNSEHYCSDCTAFAAVYGYEGGTYTLRASLSSEHQELQLGVPLQASIAASSSSLYSVRWRQLDDLLLSVTPESGRPRVWASCEVPEPSATTPRTLSLDTRDGSLLRLSATSAVEAGCGGADPALVYIAVRGDDTSVTAFTILASTDDSSSIALLVPGISLSGSVARNTFTYYQVRQDHLTQDIVHALSSPCSWCLAMCACACAPGPARRVVCGRGRAAERADGGGGHVRVGQLREQAGVDAGEGRVQLHPQLHAAGQRPAADPALALPGLRGRLLLRSGGLRPRRRAQRLQHRGQEGRHHRHAPGRGKERGAKGRGGRG
jgi:hypothetical protein